LDLSRVTIAGMIARLQGRDLAPTGLIEAVLEEIRARNGTLAAYITVLDEAAQEAARASEGRLRSGPPARPLEAIPIAVKDVVDVAGTVTTAGTSRDGAPVASRSAPVVRRLEEAGGIVVGKTNMDELALGVSTDNRHFGRCLNPWNESRIPGGSSGGSAVAVAAGLALGSLGGDSGGSIRIPAAFNGLVGLKPTNGLIDREGIFTATWTLDCCGPLARTVSDCALLFSAIGPRRSPKPARAPMKRIGIPRQYYFDAVDADVAACVEAGLRALERAGYKRVEVNTPHAALAVEAGAIISWSEFGVSQAPLLREGERGKLTPTLRDLLYAASTHLASDYIRAQQVRTLLIDEHAAIWRDVDAIATPTVPVRAPRVGEADALRVASLTRIACMTGEPALSVPVGLDANGVPVGLQLMGPGLGEATLLDMAAHVERELLGSLGRWT
jgi:aspartyl-tRNA(Asn)/glutamyl-tRNA(Gln) amidotransferase subunit A